MASTAMSVLPFIGYFLLACIVFYLVLRVVRYIKSTRGASTASLPKPVSGNAGKSIFSLGRTTAWGWRKWTAALPRVPWATVSVPVPGRGPTTKNIKNLSVELLPTTGLPPPPSATPTAPNSVMATAPLVDIGDPSTPPLTSTSTFSSFPVTPRTPSPPSHNLLGQLSAQLSVKPMYPTPAHHSYPRPPSPHALLATTPPPKHGPHKRSRSLGGVSVRRLSGGTSGLRNAVRADSDIEVEMKEIRAGIQRGQEHVRGTSREHLLIDFSSSGSSEEEVDDVSPAASDIGVLPLHGRGAPQLHFPYAPSVPPVLPVRVDARTIGRHVPLVDLGEQDTVTQDENSLDDAWRWFGSDQSLASSSSMSSSSSVTTMAQTPKNTTSSEFSLKSKIEPLVDVDLEEAPVELVSVPQTVHVRHVAADGTHLKDTLHVIESKTMALVDIDDNTSHGEARLVDLGNDEFEEQRVPTLVPVSKSPSPELEQPSTAFEAEAGYSHPLEIEAESVHVQVRPKSVMLETPLPTDPEASMLFGKAQGPQGSADPEPECLEESQLPEETTTTQVLVDVDVDAGHPSVDSGVSIPPEQDSSSWSWDEVDVEDPWNHHLSMGESTVSDPESDLITFAGGAPSSTSDETVDNIVQGDREAEELGMLEMSPGGSLLPTAVEDELECEGQDGVPVFDLASADVSLSTEQLPTAEVEFEEEEVTPKPTPVSNAVELPEVVVMDVEEEEFVYEPLVEKTAGSPLEDDEVFVYPDPDLPPLSLHLEDAPIAEQPLTTTTTLSVFAEALEAQINTHILASGSGSSQAADVAEKERLIVPASQRLPSSQTPTPPASPPPTFGSHPPQSHTHTHLRVLNPATNAASRNGSRTPSPVSPVPRLAVVLPFMEGRGEDKENDTPTALTVGRFSESLLATKPLWSIRASDAPALGIPSSGGVLGASPRMRRSVLGDVDSNVEEEVVVAEVEEEEEKVESEETDGDGDDDVLTSEAEVEGNVDEGKSEGPVVEQPTPDHREAPPMKLSTSLPGSFPDVEPTPEVVESPTSVAPAAATSTTAAAAVRRPAPTANGTAATPFVIPSARTLVRSPLDIALAMQMRPGLGAGADPAWMVRFLMAVFGWMAVAVAGGDF